MDTAAQTRALQEQKEVLEKEILDTKQKLAEQAKVIQSYHKILFVSLWFPANILFIKDCGKLHKI